jgi:membrane protein involved in colicin uptake
MEGDKWGPWLIQEERKAKAVAKAAADATTKAAAEKARQKEQEKAAKEAERQQQLRTRVWRDKSGTHLVAAEFRGIAQGYVALRKADGKIIKVPVDELSDADRKWLEELRNGRIK